MKKYWFPRLFRNIPIRSKFLIAALLLLAAELFGALFIGAHSYQVSYNEHLETAKGDFENILNTLDKFEKRLLHIYTQFQADSYSVGILSNIGSLSPDEYQTAQLDLLPSFYTMLDGSGDYTCRLYVDSTLDLIDSTAHILPLHLIEREQWGSEVMSGWGSWTFLSAQDLNDAAPALVAPLRSDENNLHLIGLLRIDIAVSSLIDKLKAPRSQSYVSCYLQTSSGETVALSGAQYGEYQLEAPAETTEGFEAQQVHTLQQNSDTVYYSTLPDSGWRIVMVVDHEKLRSAIFPQLASLILIGLVLTLIGLFFAIPILFSVMNRMRRFYLYVRAYNDNALSSVPPRLEPLGNDEVGQLIEAHNALLDRIQELLDDREQRTEELRRLEISVLQAQINPHFLYNTLETIIWMAKMNQPDLVESTIRSLTRFYRLCLSQGKDVLPVSDEIEIIRHYFDIQSVRYEQTFKLIIDVPDEMMTLLLPKITLQPLVENALLHGILESEKQEGWVRISGSKVDNHFELCVADSGAHFSQDEWKTALHENMTSSTKSVGYGLHNIERRLCLFFKESRVMRLDDSNPDETRIIITFPEQS